MPLPKFSYPIPSDGYSVFWEDVIDVQPVQGGPFRQRLDALTVTPYVNLVWGLDHNEYEEFIEIYEIELKNGALPFLIDLIIDYAEPTEVQASFVPDSIKFDGPNGDQYAVSAQLEVSPIVYDQEYYDVILMLFEEYGGDGRVIEFIIEELEHLTNVDLPQSA